MFGEVYHLLTRGIMLLAKDHASRTFARILPLNTLDRTQSRLFGFLVPLYPLPPPSTLALTTEATHVVLGHWALSVVQSNPDPLLLLVPTITIAYKFVSLVKLTQVIGLGTAGATYVFLQNFMKEDLYSPMGPVFFAGVMAYYVASSFAALLGMVGCCLPFVRKVLVYMVDFLILRLLSVFTSLTTLLCNKIFGNLHPREFKLSSLMVLQ